MVIDVIVAGEPVLPRSRSKTARFFAWLRVNLAASQFIVGLLTGSILPSLIKTTLVWSDFTHTLDKNTGDIAAIKLDAHDNMVSVDARLNLARDRALDDAAKSTKVLQDDMVDVDRRLNLARDGAEGLRHARDAEVAGLNNRLSVLEAQIKIALDRAPVPQPLGKRP